MPAAPAPDSQGRARPRCGEFDLHKNCRIWRSCKCECHKGKRILADLKRITLTNKVDEPPF